MADVYIVLRQFEMIEGRGPLKPDLNLGVFATEQAAWDAINDLPGVMGRHPSMGNVYPTDKAQGCQTWQEYVARGLPDTDYTVMAVALKGE